MGCQDKINLMAVSQEVARRSINAIVPPPVNMHSAARPRQATHNPSTIAVDFGSWGPGA
ncbi:hypothetical protein MDV011.5 [Gallid alphaherpesvirus 2]|uniref:Uncharacterized protein n=1 Tax=Gallid alphaherpesvirus 2 TaxID=10390 RepID=Q19BG0_9ALPH|nr:hypothetical protein MDV011.5 [Gallid alphaherpesvirus 2]ACF49582.1 hypothetical protein MDV011.5 [synthetic construct]ABR13070.1 hypothetical protein MDV011.5 [Gallid alphaherpesvirus 2]ACF94872.1 hypothetical protein MDV011.5 [Gallid alphaherpesvirus 2]ACR02765.1 hypothetical protein MDV011.5 [synthetic construct]